MAEDEKEKIIRRILDMPVENNKLLRQIMADLKIHSFPALFNNAVTLLAWYRDQMKDGCKIYSANEDVSISRELYFVPLELAKDEPDGTWAEQIEDPSENRR